MADETQVDREKRIFATGYMLGGRHGYAAAVEESYPELREGQTEVGAAVEEAVLNWIGGHYRPTDPKDDFA